MINVASTIDRPIPAAQTAGHHWTQLQGWDLIQSLWHVTTADLAPDELGHQLHEVCKRAGGDVGALLLKGQSFNGRGRYAPHVLMLTGQTPAEERTTLANLTWAIKLRQAIFDYLPTGPSWRYESVKLRGHERLNDASFLVLAMPSGRLLFPDWT